MERVEALAAVRRLGRRGARGLMGIRALRRPVRAVVATGLVPWWVWVRLPVDFPFTVAAPGGARFRYVGQATDGIGRALYWRGLRLWEHETFTVAAHLARRARDFWDVGANTGPFTLLACAVNPALRAHAFEPLPPAYARLLANVAANGWTDRCVLSPAAVGARAGTGALHVPREATLPTSASLTPGGFRGLPGTQVDVPVVTLRDTAGPGDPFDLLKIDVEGLEDQVLEGAGPLLGQRQPAIIVECIPDGPHRTVEGWLRPLGYRFFHLGPRGPRPRDEIVPDPRERYRNYLALPPGKLNWLP